MASKYFEGWYLKHQKDDNTVALIPGFADNTAFIQIITNTHSYNISYPNSNNKQDKDIRIGNCVFSKSGIKINIDDNINVFGEISYSNLTPIRYDVMGVFKYFPMECRHGIVSMHHNLSGQINIDGNSFDFTNGIGYIEKDSGTSFPKTYLWVQCNDFSSKCSIMASIADIPFWGHNFNGCICIIIHREKEYRLATYLGVKIECFSDEKIILKQGKYRLEIYIIKSDGNILYAPDQGRMTRTIRESASCKARFKFFIKEEMLFDYESNHASFEFVQ